MLNLQETLETEYSTIYIGWEANQKLGLGILLWLQLQRKLILKFLKLPTLRGESLSFTLNSLLQNILFLINEKSINKLWKKIFIQHCLKFKAIPKHAEIINLIPKTLLIKADFFVTIIALCDKFKGHARIYTELFTYFQKYFEKWIYTVSK